MYVFKNLGELATFFANNAQRAAPGPGAGIQAQAEARVWERAADIVRNSTVDVSFGTFARNTDVVSRDLSDGSVVYDARLRLDNGGTLTFTSPDMHGADRLVQALRNDSTGLEYDPPV